LPTAAEQVKFAPMDLRSFKVHRADRHVRAVLVSGRGEQGRDLEGPAFDRVDAVAAPLWDALQARAGAPVRALAVDAVARTTTLSLADRERPGLRLDGAEFEAIVDLLAPVARTIRGELFQRSADVPGLGPSDPNFWDAMFRADSGGWELGRPSPPLETWFLEHSPKDLRALVVGCGRGHDARMLARLGARVTAIDLAPTAIAEARAATDPALAVDFQQRDLFTLAGGPAEFDLVVEHTCFCAIDLARRDEYVDCVADVLRPGGALVGLFYAHGRAGGPPFTTSRDEVVARFARRFDVVRLETAANSILVRHRHELLAELRRR
jgi:SAM-dependent methyltransferase